MPIIYEEVEKKSELSQKEKNRLKERILYSNGKRQVKYNETHALKIKEYLRNYYLKNKQQKLIDKGIINPENPGSLGKIRSAKENRIIKRIEESEKNPIRTRISLQDVKNIMEEILIGRCKNYSNNDKMKKKIMCIIGESGVGKTLASLHLQYHLKANVICSFTNRPPRETEIEGREHHFIDIEPPKDDILAYAKFGGYDYYALKSQVTGPCTVYVIDEDGFRNLKDKFGNEYDLFTVYITRSKKLREDRDIDRGRMQRDKRRKKLDKYDYTVVNESTKAEFFRQIEEIYNEIKEK